MWEGKRFRLHHLWIFLITAAFSFWCGRVTVGPNISRTNCPGNQDETYSHSKGVDLHIHKDSSPGSLADPWRPSKADWAQLGEDVGLRRHKPPLPTGDSGTRDYIIQPYQVSNCSVVRSVHGDCCSNGMARNLTHGSSSAEEVNQLHRLHSLRYPNTRRAQGRDCLCNLVSAHLCIRKCSNFVQQGGVEYILCTTSSWTQTLRHHIHTHIC
jgi:hypothetical protein